jgi:hypothetical protein
MSRSNPHVSSPRNLCFTPVLVLQYLMVIFFQDNHICFLTYPTIHPLKVISHFQNIVSERQWFVCHGFNLIYYSFMMSDM